MNKVEKFVVISAKKIHGSRVMCIAQSQEKCEEALISIQNAAHLATYGPFSIIPAKEAEKKRLYGD